MGGGMNEEVKCYFPSRTMVLMGRSGNGKSATGNSILGKPSFKSGTSLSGVTTTANCDSTTLTNGETVNVIDTPGLFGLDVDSDFINKQIENVVEFAKNGIHAVLLVLSVRGRFTEEEVTALENLQTFFGPKIIQYVIVVFTGSLEDESLEDFISSGPEPLQRILQVCENRSILFDNKTKNVETQALQIQRLMNLVEEVMEKNNGQPYSGKMYAEFREEVAKLEQQKGNGNASTGHKEYNLSELNDVVQKSYEEHMGMVESNLMVTNERLKQELAYETAARLKVEQVTQRLREKSKDEVRKLKKSFEAKERIFQVCRRRRPEDDATQNARDGWGNFSCAIM